MNLISFDPGYPSAQFGLTVVLQLPQWDELLFKSEQTPEQHAGVMPVHGVAVQDPQRLTLLFKSVQVPLQQEA
ncbi:hypothetical protein N7528_009330 [Penicillium herquei]|nr:hypothetical protein N7528_009330 [Penicillium herquei]